jgi:hypothetical protein
MLKSKYIAYCYYKPLFDVESWSKEVSSRLYHNTKYFSFEHSLVEELGYTGFQKLRIAFDKAFGGEEKVPKFDLVVDAGCGTGLVGEQVRAFLSLSTSTPFAPGDVHSTNSDHL